MYAGDTIEFEQEGFSIRAEIHYDETPDTSWIGEFSDKPGDNAVDHHATDNWLGRDRGPRWFNPATEHAALDYARLLAYYQDEWSMVGIAVTASREGVALGSGSLWGIESDSGDGFFRETAEEIASEAVAEAKATLAALVASAK